MIITTNVASLNAQRSLTATNNAMQKSLEKLSSGYRINKAADDAAGLAISEKMRGQIRGLQQAQRNAQDGISMIQTAEGALTETHSILQRMRELAVQAANDTNTAADRSQIQAEIDALKNEVKRIAGATEFNTKKLIDGSLTAKAGRIQVGANQNQVITVAIATMGLTGLGLATMGVSTFTHANSAIGLLDKAISSVSTQRAKLGALQNRLEHTIANLGTAAENLTAAESRIRDVDMAKEMSEFTKNQVLSQAGVAMLAQANQAPQAVLKLLG